MIQHQQQQQRASQHGHQQDMVSTPQQLSVEILYGSDCMTFGWRQETRPEDFVQKFREMVSYVTKYADLKTIQIFQEKPPPPRGATSQQIGLQQIYEGQCTAVRLTRTDGVDPQQVRRPQSVPQHQHQQQESTYQRQASFGPETGVPYVNSGCGPSPYPVETSLPATSSRPAPKPVPKRDAKFQKAGGSQLAFIRMMSMNKNPVGPLGPGQILNAAEVAKHASPADCWIIMNGRVYDVTPYLKFHPGGKEQIMRGAGQDCTQLFMESHSWVSIDGLIGMLCLGKLVK
eukprot:gnl/MRDRNA2_/MRDRNA2_124233_c0_seq1.p1 gnl/MRDRNA2_/MRDRNA2_124233_c0~~gnl/MRDRNA2_/MRDRNA2_124233_c0_seq1.p1  ORF type:complete len:287 (-),score=45.44 gnl/MRDRNA2_/MRDRNA2_124233_c0_seq1:50-910(-)